MTSVVAFLFTVLINYAIIVHILGDATMKTTDFEQHGIKRKKAFVDDKLARKVLNELFPVMQSVSNNDINVVNYVVFRRKRLIDIVVRYKDLYLPIALDFSIDTDLDGLHIKGYQAFYTFHLYIDNDQLQSFVFDNNRKSDFNVNTLQEFLGEEAERFTILYDSYYNKESSPMEKKKSKNNIGTTSNSLPFVPNTLPFPQRFQKKRIDAQFSKFLDIFKKLEINLPFVESLEQMPKYAKFMKDVLSKKKKYGDYETVELIEECSAVLQRKLSQS